MSAITTHILDTARGLPAADVRVELRRKEGESWVTLGSGVTNADGRNRELIPDGTPFEAGQYLLRFEVGAYFESLGQTAFFPEVQINFVVSDATTHYHVPLLLSPFGYSTYRGS